MTGSVACVIRCGQHGRLLLDTLRSLDVQRSLISEAVVVVDPSTASGLSEWIESVAAVRGYPVVRCASSRPASIWNVGCAKTTGEIILCLGAGDRLLPEALGNVLHAFDESSRTDVLLAPVMRREMERVVAVGPAGTSRFAIASRPETVHSATPFRRRALADIGGFDESLAAYAPADAVLRLIAHGHGVGTIDTALVTATEAWLNEHESESEPFLARHIESLAQDPATALRLLEDELQRMSVPYERLRRERLSAREEIESLRARRAAMQPQPPRLGDLDLGQLGRTTPLSRDWGYDRGTPVDRHFIERFLEAHRADIHGRVLEIQEADYTRRFGGSRVTQSDVLDIEPSNPRATVIADLREAPNLPSESYDCVIVTQTLHVIAEMQRVIAECARVLKPGGVMLATLPCSSRVCLEYGPDGDFWRVTEAGARRLFEEVFPSDCVEAHAHGNVLASAAFQYGLGLQEVDRAALEQDDPFNPTLVVVRASKRAPTASRVLQRDGSKQNVGVVLLYHRVAAAQSDVHGLCVAPNHFAEQIAFLKETCTLLPLHELRDAAAAGMIPRRAVAITFDDAYVDVLQEAVPVLLGRGVPATVFATTAPPLESPAFHYWWDVLEWAMLSAPAASTLSVTFEDGTRTFPVGTTPGRLAAHRAIHSALVPLEAARRDAILLQILNGRDPDHHALPRRLAAAELRALASQPGMTIGAHGHDHLALPAHSADRQRVEIRESRVRLEALLEREILAFAYPFGAWSPASSGIARDAGIQLAVTCEERPIQADVDWLACPRVGVPPSTTEGFIALLERTLALESGPLLPQA